MKGQSNFFILFWPIIVTNANRSHCAIDIGLTKTSSRQKDPLTPRTELVEFIHQQHLFSTIRALTTYNYVIVPYVTLVRSRTNVHTQSEQSLCEQSL